MEIWLMTPAPVHRWFQLPFCNMILRGTSSLSPAPPQLDHLPVPGLVPWETSHCHSLLPLGSASSMGASEAIRNCYFLPLGKFSSNSVKSLGFGPSALDSRYHPWHTWLD